MDKYLEARCKQVTIYIVKHEATVRKAAQFFRISKSTVYKDITERIREVDTNLANKAKLVLAKNKAERHIRGGKATKAKYSRNGPD